MKSRLIIANNEWKKVNLWEVAREERLIKTKRALELAKSSFSKSGLRRRDGRGWLIHSYRVGQILYFFMNGCGNVSDKRLAAGVAHDIKEDINVSLEIIRKLLGIEVADIVDAVSIRKLKGESEDKTSYFKRALDSRDSAIVKVADCIHNLKNMTKHAGKKGFSFRRLSKFTKESKIIFSMVEKGFISNAERDRDELYFLYVEFGISIDNAQRTLWINGEG